MIFWKKIIKVVKIQEEAVVLKAIYNNKSAHKNDISNR
jgi:hypothetical protein